MSMEQLKQVLFGCCVFDAILLGSWFALFIVARDGIYRAQSRWFQLHRDHFDTINYCGMGLFKLFAFVFHVAPYLSMSLQVF